MRKAGLNIDMDYEFLENQSMAEYTTFKVGGTAKRLYKVYSVDGLKEVLDICGDEKPIIKSAEGDFELYVDKRGFVIGGMEGIKSR